MLRIKAIAFQIGCMILMSLGVNAQNISIEKVVYSLQENIPIENVHVLTSDATVYTNSIGEFQINFKSYLEFSHIGYDSLRFNDINQIPDTIWLSRKNTALDDVTINSERTINQIEKESRYKIKTFELIDNHLIVLKKKYVGRQLKLCLYDLEGLLLDEFELKNNFEDLTVNCLGQLFLIGKAKCVLIDVSNDQLVFDSESNRSDFNSLFEKCVLYNNGQWVYEFKKNSGLETTIVSIRNGKDKVLKKIVLDELLQLKRKNQWKIDLGANIGTITTNDYGENQEIRELQEDSDFLDNVLLKRHEHNSFAIMEEGILMANAHLDSLHYIGLENIDKSIQINKNDIVLNDVEKIKCYFFQKEDNEQYKLSEINEELQIQKLLSIDQQEIFKIRATEDKIFYLAKDGSNSSVKINLYFESI